MSTILHVKNSWKNQSHVPRTKPLHVSLVHGRAGARGENARHPVTVASKNVLENVLAPTILKGIAVRVILSKLSPAELKSVPRSASGVAGALGVIAALLATVPVNKNVPVPVGAMMVLIVAKVIHLRPRTVTGMNARSYANGLVGANGGRAAEPVAKMIISRFVKERGHASVPRVTTPWTGIVMGMILKQKSVLTLTHAHHRENVLGPAGANGVNAALLVVRMQ